MNRYEDFDDLTTTMLNEFVEKVVVHERELKCVITNLQKVEIYFNFIGNYEPPQKELSEEERKKIEEDKKLKEERRLKYRQNYLKPKASG